MKRYLFIVMTMLFVVVTPAAAQTPTPPITPTATIAVSNTEWLFPEEPLVAYTYTEELDQSPISYTITKDDIWKSARVALTTYELMGVKTWIYFGVVLLVPIAAAFIFRLFSNPPEV